MIPKKNTKRQLRRKHGTPAQFETAVWKAVGEISVSEAKRAIDNYNQEYAAAK